MNIPEAPKAKKIVSTTTLHGDQRDDSYAWLKDQGWQEVLNDPSALANEIREHLEAENAYTRSVTEAMAGLESEMIKEMRSRIAEEVTFPPTRDGEWLYYSRQVTGGEYPLFCRKSALLPDAPEEVLFDGNKEAKGKSHFSVGIFAHSPDHRYVMYSLDLNGSEIYQLYVKELTTGVLLDDEIGRVSDAVWGNSSATIYYTRLDEHLRPEEVYRHTLGTPNDSDELVYKTPALGSFVTIGKTQSKSYLTISVDDHDSSEVYLLPADGSALLPTLIAPREKSVRYSVLHHPDGYLLIITNAFEAEDFQIMKTSITAPEKTNWVPFIEHRSGILITSALQLKDHLIRVEEARALPRIVVRNKEGVEHTIDFEEEAYNLSIVNGFEFETNIIRFVYSSPATPDQIYDYNMDTKERVLVHEKVIPTGHDPKNYMVKRISATSHDGVSIPITLLYRNDMISKKPAPCLLYGYGAYGISMEAYFNSRCLSLVDRGFVFAVAHIRGGMENGYHWYLDGKMMKKKNTFFDFIAAAEMIIKKGYTTPKQIAIEGGSAGGLLVGAVVNMRPDLFGAVAARVPFVDVLNTMCDTTLPLTPMEWLEWGNPLIDKDAYEYIRSYSPYENVTAQEYPHMLVTAGLTDPRVTYWEPAKWVATLREHAQGRNLILLRTEMEHGHQGSTGRFKSLADDARVYAFILFALSGKFSAQDT